MLEYRGMKHNVNKRVASSPGSQTHIRIDSVARDGLIVACNISLYARISAMETSLCNYLAFLNSSSWVWMSFFISPFNYQSPDLLNALLLPKLCEIQSCEFSTINDQLFPNTSSAIWVLWNVFVEVASGINSNSVHLE